MATDPTTGNTGARESSDSDGRAAVVACRACEGPVVKNAVTCPACSAPLNGKEMAYIVQREAGPDIAGMIKWWGIWSLLVWALAGFSFGVISSLIFTGITCVYLVRILRAYYS